jgi:GTP-binding protein HflX
MNALAGTDLLVENKLFSTLDATTRRVVLEHGHEALLTDTVGFTRKLPHGLVASFRTTLDEINNADLVIHVADVTSPSLEAHLDTVSEVLGEILDGPRETLLVLNKIDLLPDRSPLHTLLRHYPEALVTSARSGEGLETLRRAIQRHLEARTVEVELRLLREAGRILSFCYREGRVVRQDHDEVGRLLLRVQFPAAAYEKLLSVHGEDCEILATLQGGHHP